MDDRKTTPPLPVHPKASDMPACNMAPAEWARLQAFLLEKLMPLQELKGVDAKFPVWRVPMMRRPGSYAKYADDSEIAETFYHYVDYLRDDIVVFGERFTVWRTR